MKMGNTDCSLSLTTEAKLALIAVWSNHQMYILLLTASSLSTLLKFKYGRKSDNIFNSLSPESKTGLCRFNTTFLFAFPARV